MESYLYSCLRASNGTEQQQQQQQSLKRYEDEILNKLAFNMSSALDIQIVSTPNLEKIESFFKDVSYRESIEFSANFNTRLCIERRHRLPFIDPQTGVAQNHSHLFLDKRQRMPGFKQGQLYTYPAARWRKTRRQYMSRMYRFPDRPFQALRKEQEALVCSMTTATALTAATVNSATPPPPPPPPTIVCGVGSLLDPDFNGALQQEESTSLGGVGGDTSDSKDSQQQPQDLPKEWFYDDINDVDSLEEPKSPADDEYDYDPRYGSKKRRKRRPGKRATLTPGEGMGGSTKRRRGRIPAAAATAIDPSIVSNMDSSDGVLGDFNTTPSSSTAGRRPRGTGTRGRRRTKAIIAGALSMLDSGVHNEPPSFESAAAAVGVGGDLPVVEEHGDLRNYRKYL